MLSARDSTASIFREMVSWMKRRENEILPSFNFFCQLGNEIMMTVKGFTCRATGASTVCTLEGNGNSPLDFWFYSVDLSIKRLP